MELVGHTGGEDGGHVDALGHVEAHGYVDEKSYDQDGIYFQGEGRTNIKEVCSIHPWIKKTRLIFYMVNAHLRIKFHPHNTNI